MSGEDAIDVARLARTRSAAMSKQILELAAGEVLAVDARSWRDAIVFITAGQIDIECAAGSTQRFGEGHILCFAQISVRTLRNCGRDYARLLIIRRRTTG